MRKIITISSIWTDDGRLLCKTKSKRGCQLVHLRQGDMDGACSVYSLVMNLMIIGSIDRKDIEVYTKHNKTTALGRLVTAIKEKNGLYHNGKDYSEIVKLLRTNFKQKVDATLDDKVKNMEVVDKLARLIKDDTPVIISVEYSGGAHSLLAIGLSYNSEDMVDKILCLDPGFDAPTTSLWNSVISVSAIGTKKYPYIWETNKNAKCCLGEILIVQKK